MPADYQKIKEANIREYGEGKRHLAVLGRLYTDRTHFVFELLQNAEDAGATEVIFTLRNDCLEVQHDGRSFSADDVIAICGIDASTKAEDLTRIGKFGLGFKSVYAFTNRPEIHSGDERFCIEDFVRPNEVAPRDVLPARTLFVLPFDRDDVPASTAVTEIGDALSGLKPTTLLFLRSISAIWVEGDGVEDVMFQRSNDSLSPGVENVVLTQTTGKEERSEWRVYSRQIESGPVGGLPVQLAFKVDPENGRITGIPRSPLVAFFPTAKETNLGFLIQGPYRTTPARDNVPEHDEWNRDLIGQTGELLRTALLELRDSGLLDWAAIQALPIVEERFKPDSMFRPIYAAALHSLKTEALIPTSGGEFRLAAEVRLAGSKALRELLDECQLASLVGSEEPVAWVQEGISGRSTAQLWEYIHGALGIEEVSPQMVVERLTKELLVAQSDEWMVRFYSMLGGNERLWKPDPPLYRSTPARFVPIIRLEDGSHVRPFLQDDQPAAYLPGDRASEFPTVRASLMEDKATAALFKKMGMRQPNVEDEVRRFVLPRYSGSPAFPDWQQHSEDLDLIEQALKALDGKKLSGLKQELREAKLVWSYNPHSGRERAATPNSVYLESPEIMLFFEHDPDALVVSPNYEQGQRTVFKDLGADSSPRVSSRPANRKGYVVIRSDWGKHSRGLDRFDPDARIEGLRRALEHPRVERSRYVWNELLRANKHLISGTVQESSRQSFDEPRSEEKRSEIGVIAASLQWIPSPEGGWVRPDQLRPDQLPPGFEPDSRLEEALGMVDPGLELIAATFGLSREEIDVAREHPAEVRQFLGELSAENRSRAEAADPVPWHSSADLEFAETLEPVFDRSSTHGAELRSILANGVVSNPQFRRERLGEEIAETRSSEPSTDARFETRPRKVWEPKDPSTRFFLKEQYGGHCQVCRATFPKRNGEPYFEAVALVSRTEARWIDRPGNYLCLCATCTAKFQFGAVVAENVAGQIRSWQPAVEGGGEPRLAIRLCGADVQLAFTEKHFLELQELFFSGSRGHDADVFSEEDFIWRSLHDTDANAD